MTPKVQITAGERQLQRILAVIRSEALSVRDIAGKVHLSESAVLRHVAALRAAKRAYVAGFRPSAGNTKPTKLVRAGHRPDAVYRVKSRKRPCRKDAHRKRMRELLALPQTSEALAARMGLSITRTRTFIAELRAAKIACIVDWQLPPTKGSQAPVYALGSGPDKPRQRRMPRVLVSRRPSISAWAAGFGVGAP
jgi:DNA-binding Lrp family transcriptional regulator